MRMSHTARGLPKSGFMHGLTPGITSDHEAEERAVGSGAAAIPSGSVTHADSRAGWVAGDGGEAKGERGGERNGMGGGYGSGGGGGDTSGGRAGGCGSGAVDRHSATGSYFAAWPASVYKSLVGSPVTTFFEPRMGTVMTSTTCAPNAVFVAVGSARP